MWINSRGSGAIPYPLPFATGTHPKSKDPALHIGDCDTVRYEHGGKSKAKKAAGERSTARNRPEVPRPAPSAAKSLREVPQPAPAAAKPNAEIVGLQKRLATEKKKLDKAKASGKPTKAVEDRIYEIEDELRLAGQA